MRHATRDWAGLAGAKADYRAVRKTTMAPAEIMQLGDDLRRHALAVRPDWPNAADRETDAAARRRVSEALDPESAAEFVARVGDAGFALRVSPADGFVEKTRVFPFLHTPTGWPLDVVLAGPGLEELFLARAVDVGLGDGVHVSVIRPRI